MTSEGLNRLATLFINDIATVKYDLDGIEKIAIPASKSVTNNVATIIIIVDDIENGLFNNFRVISGFNNIILTTRNINFTKTFDGIRLEIPFTFINV